MEWVHGIGGLAEAVAVLALAVASVAQGLRLRSLEKQVVEHGEDASDEARRVADGRKRPQGDAGGL